MFVVLSTRLWGGPMCTSTTMRKIQWWEPSSTWLLRTLNTVKTSRLSYRSSHVHTHSHSHSQTHTHTVILYLSVFFHDSSTNKVLRYSPYQVCKLTWNNDAFRKSYQTNSQNLREHQYHRLEIHWLTWTKSCRWHTLVSYAQKCGTKWYKKRKRNSMKAVISVETRRCAILSSEYYIIYR